MSRGDSETYAHKRRCWQARQSTVLITHAPDGRIGFSPTSLLIRGAPSGLWPRACVYLDHRDRVCRVHPRAVFQTYRSADGKASNVLSVGSGSASPFLQHRGCGECALFRIVLRALPSPSQGWGVSSGKMTETAIRSVCRLWSVLSLSSLPSLWGNCAHVITDADWSKIS